MRIFNLLIILLLSALSTTVMGQVNAFKANIDNYFVTPGVARSLDVLENDIYAEYSTLRNLSVTILAASSKGSTSINPVTKRITYTPQAGYWGPDKFQYQISAVYNSTTYTSSAWVYLNVSDKPDAISDNTCYVDPEPIVWGIKELAKTSGGVVNTLATPHVGDIDNDGETEIMILNYAGNRDYDKLLIYGYRRSNNSLYLKYTINLTNSSNYGVQNLPYQFYSFANVKDNSNYASIYTSADGLLIKWKYVPGANPPSTGSFVEDWRRDYATSNNIYYKKGVPLLVDLMGDGNVQVCVYDKIYDAVSGNLLVELTDDLGNSVIPAAGYSSYSFGANYGHSIINGNMYYKQSLMQAGDIDGDGVKELIGGDCVYRINIQDYSNNAVTGGNNSFKLFRRANRNGANINTVLDNTRTDISEGSTVLVDMDLDGQLDVVVSSGPLNSVVGYVYVYNPRTGQIMHTNQATIVRHPTVPANGPSLPFVGDINGDGYPEICLTSYAILKAFRLNGNSLDEYWSLPTTDTSSSTTLSLFDFDQSGKAKLVYRDITTLRIIDGRSDAELAADPTDNLRVKYTFNNVMSATVNEMPVIADVNGDGAAEIIVTGNSTSGEWYGELMVYSSNGAPWAPARDIWHQNAYNPLYINDDLTIPSKPINPSTVFYETKSDGTVVQNRPFNNFLQQSTNLNREGSMIQLGPDLAFDATVPKLIRLDGSGNTVVSFGIINQGDAAFTGPVRIQLYAKSGAVFTAVGAGVTYGNAATVIPYQTGSNKVSITNYVIPKASMDAVLGYDDLYLTINQSVAPDQIPQFAGSVECRDGWNNRASGLSFLYGSHVMCEGDTENINVYPTGSYLVKWYTGSVGGAALTAVDAQGSRLNVTKNSSAVTHYFVEAWTTDGATKLSPVRDTVFVYSAPAELHWTGSGNTRNWHDYQNWSNPSSNLNPVGNIPRSCTDVLIPGGLTYYPSLTSSAVDVMGTDYSIYSVGECNHIEFEHGGELQHPDKLSYVTAEVNVDLQSHRWYMFAPPLKDFYTGDIYRNNVIPSLDDVKAYAKFWARRNPYRWAYSVGWTGLFYNPDQRFDAGQGFGLWISDVAYSNEANPWSVTRPFSFNFPKNDTDFYLYKEGTTTIAEGPFPVSRTNSSRFIFDGLPDASGNFTLKIDGESTQAGDMVMVANPFMSQLDFDLFYAANSALIRNYYQLIDEGGQMQYYNGSTSTLSNRIAPMQSFLVELRSGTNSLIANGNMTVSRVSADNSLRSISERGSSGNYYLRIEARQGGSKGVSYLCFSDVNDNESDDNDLSGLFGLKSGNLHSLSSYSRKDSGSKMFVNHMNADKLKGGEIEIGIFTPSSEALTLNIGNLSSLPSDIKAYLHDSKTNISYDLMRSSMYNFDDIDPDNDLFVEDRFSLRFVHTPDGGNSLEEISDRSLSISCRNSELKVSASSVIDEVRVYNLMGSLLGVYHPKSAEYEVLLAYSDLYIVQVVTGSSAHTRKIINSK